MICILSTFESLFHFMHHFSTLVHFFFFSKYLDKSRMVLEMILLLSTLILFSCGIIEVKVRKIMCVLRYVVNIYILM